MFILIAFRFLQSPCLVREVVLNKNFEKDGTCTWDRIPDLSQKQGCFKLQILLFCSWRFGAPPSQPFLLFQRGTQRLKRVKEKKRSDWDW